MKKIDDEKSLILGIKENDTEGLRLGIHGYFSCYRNFKTYVEGNLDGFTRTDFMSIQEHSEGHFESQWYDYFIPADRVVFIEEGKKLRPFKDLCEFTGVTGRAVGNVITFKKKNSDTEYCLLFNGHAITKDGDVLIYLGAKYYVLKELCDDYLYYKDGVWLPFGIEE